MRYVSGLQRFIAVAFLVFFSAVTTPAQSDRGTIAGTMLDSTGAVVANASITVTGVATGAVYKTTSTSTGAYRIQDLQVGTYDIVVEVPGFKTAKQTGFVIQISSVAALDITLQPGVVTQTLEVVADAPTLQTESSDIGTVVTTRQIEELPLAVASSGQSNLRSPEAFVFITPGTTGPGSSDSSSGTFQAKLAGGQNFGNEILLDGASTARADSGSAFDQTAPSVEALEEFKVTTSTVPADFGRTSGGVESFTTKSGTNTFHGSAFDIFRNDDLNANTWFNNLQHLPRNPDKKNDYGGTFGGPVWIPKVYNGRDKTFFFFAWEQFRQTQGSTSISTVPTMNERAGNFASLVNRNNPLGTNPCDGSTIFQGQIFDPSTTRTVGGQLCRTAFPNNQVPVSAVAQNTLTFTPPPTPGRENQPQNNFVLGASTPILDTAWTVRADHNFSQNNDKLYFSFSKRVQDQFNTAPNFPVPVDVRFHHPFNTYYYRVGWDHFFSTTLLNHFNVGLNRILNQSISTSANGTDWPAKLGISGAHGPIFPQIQFSNDTQGLSNYGTANDDTDSINSLVLADNVSWTTGRHTVRFGFDWRAFQFSHIDRAHESPFLNFDIGQTAAEPNQGTTTGDPFAAFLIGAPSTVSLAIRSSQPRFVSSYYAGFIQDDFKIRKNLMLNLGLRYDVETPRHESSYNQSIIDLTAPNPGAISPSGSPLLGALIFGGHGQGRSGTSASGATTYWKDFAPRLGFSYAPESLFGRFRNTVVRGGYSIYYAPLSYADFGVSLTDGFTASPNFGSDGYHFAVDPRTGNPVLLSTGVPAFPAPPNLDPAQENGQGGGGFGGPTYVAKSYGRPGMVQNWSFEVEHQLAPDLILSVGYVGTHATRLRSALAQINDLNPSFFSLGSCLTLTLNNTAGTPCANVTAPFTQFNSVYGGGATVAQALRPFPQYQDINSDCCLENLGQSTYNAMLLKVERRFRNGLNLLASYTYSKTLTDADSALPSFATFSGGGNVQNPHNLKGEKSLSYQDIPHTFVLSYLYELPVGPGKKFAKYGGALGRVVGGWEIGGVQRYQSGQPIAFGGGTGVPGFSGSIRLNRVPGQPLLSPTAGSFNVGQVFLNGCCTVCTENLSNGTFTAPAGVATYFNCAAFIDPNPNLVVKSRGSYAFGNFPRITGEVRSYRYINEDFSISKRTQIREGHSIILKAELINAFNRHVFTRPDAGPTDGSFGSSFGTIEDPRKVQFTLRYQF